MSVFVLAALALAAGLAAVRWLRVAQREHYLAGSVARFAWRWWSLDGRSIALGLVAVAAAVATIWYLPAGLITAAAVAAGPPGLGLRGRSSRLGWTTRLKRLTAGVAVLVALALLGGWLVHPIVAAMAVVGLPWLVDASLALLAPIEKRLGNPWVDKAAAALRDSGATIVAITGSYGKTSTKGYIAQLVGGSKRVLASPASFNNRMGLARAINEHLAGGLDVFVAEMGTYGPGEIAELCSWIPPDISVITAIGPVHLERFGTEERIVDAKSEILERAGTAVLNVDDARLSALAAEQAAARRTVVRVGTGDEADVAVRDGVVLVEGEVVGRIPGAAHPTNVACAVGVAVSLGVPLEAIARRLGDLAEPEHRRTLGTGSTGVLIIDDTFNANPEGARSALRTLLGAGVTGRTVVVTPGMVELGSRQSEENRLFAAEAAAAVDHFIVVGRTNRKALTEGATGGRATVDLVPSREDAVEWVRSNLGSGDAVLYENDLPDHYP
ncbi:MAG TPA: UDP-N-acetylmuramoyl-tripeptide--D-alanyl-D-alanine ligase [Acidimicrobiia bacterium]|nr:UDP-N-acetylmuramoyl-tripeptide--D-alanyl-D-alanine ligase [Acidimicrobiia bacterium]